jgi:uncharacterized protein involved in exopolysaccharide biosynthesis
VVNERDVQAKNGTPPDHDDQLTIDIGGALRAISEGRSIYVAVITVAIVVTIGFLLLLPNVYTSTVTILPGTGYSGSAAMLNRLGIGGMEGGGRLSPVLYGEVFRSGRVLDRVLDAPYADSTAVPISDMLRKGGSQLEFWRRFWPKGGRNNDELGSARFEMKKMLRRAIEVDIDKINGFVVARYTHTDPSVAAAVLSAVIAQSDSLMRSEMQAQAVEKLVVLDARISAISDSMSIAESDLLRFRESNQAIVRSPKLLLEEQRLRRAVDLRQTIYIELRRQQELTLLDSSGGRRAITILDAPEVPWEKSGPFRARILVIVFVLVFCAVTLHVLTRRTWLYVAVLAFILTFLPRRWHATLRLWVLGKGRINGDSNPSEQ